MLIFTSISIFLILDICYVYQEIVIINMGVHRPKPVFVDRLFRPVPTLSINQRKDF